MAIIIRSREAEAAQRFVEATRNVEVAFRAVRGEAEFEVSSMAHGAAQSRLDHALDELARAEALFDSVVSVQGRRHGPNHLDT
ncbi:hypothetical protein WJ542_26885 [Paraburkholderia sp. B3]|uniref:hypothetical protein n=1 Tax=Paraburkholderia sp. B3 TaxID=3134791 RepID=UPI003982C359